MSLSELQERILQAKDKYVFVNSAAASGKTALLCEKVRRSINEGKKAVAFTFTNMAASTMRQRLGVENGANLFIGTIHSYCAHLLFKNGITAARKLIEDEDFDELFRLINENPQCIEDIDICLCDETQDSNEDQLNFIFNLIKAKEYFIVYDLRQSIYQFAKSRPKLLVEYGEKLGATVYSMNENYRNGSSILTFAKRIINRTGLCDDSISMRDISGQVEERYYSLVDIINIIRNSGSNYGDWAIIARTNASVDVVFNGLKKVGIPCDTFKQGDLKKNELDRKMESNTVKVLTIHSSKGLEFNNVMVIDARYYNDEELSVSYVAATRAKNRLIWFKQPPKKPKRRW